MPMQQTTMPWLVKVSHAILSEDRVYRYALYRSLDGQAWDREFEHNSVPQDRRTVLFVMLNPSTASEEENDPTIDKIMKYSRRWGYDRLAVCNLFAYRETDSRKLRSLASATDLVGPDNNTHLRAHAMAADKIVCAWGKEGIIQNRGVEVAKILDEVSFARGTSLWCFKKNLDNSPVHPLYQPDAAELIEYR